MNKALTHAGLLRIYRAGEGGESTTDQCPICFESVPSLKRKQLKLACDHMICDLCARVMCVISRKTCPICRREDAIYCECPFDIYEIQFKRQQHFLFDIECEIPTQDITDFVSGKTDITEVSCSVETANDHLNTVMKHFRNRTADWKVEPPEQRSASRTPFRVKLKPTIHEATKEMTLVKLLVTVVKHCHDFQPNSDDSEQKEKKRKKKRRREENDITKTMTRRKPGGPAVPYVFPIELAPSIPLEESPGKRTRLDG